MKKETKKDRINDARRKTLLYYGVCLGESVISSMTDKFYNEYIQELEQAVQDDLNPNECVKPQKKPFRVIKRTTHRFDGDLVYYQLQSRTGLFNNKWIDYEKMLVHGSYFNVAEALFNRDILNGDIQEVEEIVIPDKK